MAGEQPLTTAAKDSQFDTLPVAAQKNNFLLQLTPQ